MHVWMHQYYTYLRNTDLCKLRVFPVGIRTLAETQVQWDAYPLQLLTEYLPAGFANYRDFLIMLNDKRLDGKRV